MIPTETQQERLAALEARFVRWALTQPTARLLDAGVLALGLTGMVDPERGQVLDLLRRGLDPATGSFDWWLLSAQDRAYLGRLLGVRPPTMEDDDAVTDP